MATVALVGPACGGSDDAGSGEVTPVCAAIADLARLDALSNQAMSREWDAARPVLEQNLQRTDDAYRAIVEADDGALAAAAEDLLAFDEAIVSSGAFEASSRDQFLAALDGLPGSAEAGAADAVLREHAADECA